MTHEHPARAAAQRSMEAVHRKDKEAWVANFADDAILEDPIGRSPLDPDGQGHRGREAIAAFWDKQIGPNRVLFNVARSYAAGSEVANVGTITIVMEGGLVTLVDGVFTYRVNEAGKVTALRAFWEIDRLKLFPPASPPSAAVRS
ncbi:MAG: nuclear transport factor 2 family protein [Myxococcales bacterium]|nr:nuclear transport factor 2 family protein [Myxococcales bacterium]